MPAGQRRRVRGSAPPPPGATSRRRARAAASPPGPTDGWSARGGTARPSWPGAPAPPWPCHIEGMRRRRPCSGGAGSSGPRIARPGNATSGQRPINASPACRQILGGRFVGKLYTLASGVGEARLLRAPVDAGDWTKRLGFDRKPVVSAKTCLDRVGIFYTSSSGFGRKPALLAKARGEGVGISYTRSLKPAEICRKNPLTH